MDTIGFSRSIENIIKNYSDLIESEAGHLRSTYEIESADELEKVKDKIMAENRLLEIGIVGRVKAGKSSLLNALLFNGESVLPKAATPMTAALTVITYGESISAEVEFFNEQDIAVIKKEHDNVESLISNELAVLLKKGVNSSNPDRDELRKKAERIVRRNCENNITMTASYDQFEKIKNSGISYHELENTVIIDSVVLSELKEQMLEYVGANGKYMPFTKSVTLKLPYESLKGISLVDTPGINDPVASREARTNTLLNSCDVIFIVTPSGQFFSGNDVDLMDRIWKKDAKKAVRELYVAASQVDLTLHSNLCEENNGKLDAVLEKISESHFKQVASVIDSIKSTNSEVGDIYDQLLNENRIILTSGMCETLINSFKDKSICDAAAQKAWENLTKNYPDYFSEHDAVLSVENLRKLSNKAKLHDVIGNVKEMKDQILQRKRASFLDSKRHVLTEYRNELVSYSREQINILSGSDLETLNKNKQNLSANKDKASFFVNDAYLDSVGAFISQIQKELNNGLKKYFDETGKNIKGAEETVSETYKVDLDGTWNSFLRFLGTGGTDTRTRQYTSIRIGAVNSAFSELISDIESSIEAISRDAVVNWKKSLIITTTKAMRECISDENIDKAQLLRAVRNVIDSVKLPELNYSEYMPDSGGHGGLLERFKNFIGLPSSGVLKGSDAKNYIEMIGNHLTSFKRKVENDNKNFINTLENKLKGINFTYELFKQMDAMISSLIEQINTKTVICENYKRLIKELEEIA